MKKLFLLLVFCVSAFSCSDETVIEAPQFETQAKEDPVPAWITTSRDGEPSVLFDAKTLEPQPEWVLCNSYWMGDSLISVYRSGSTTYTLMRRWTHAFMEFNNSNNGAYDYGGYTMYWKSFWGGSC